MIEHDPAPTCRVLQVKSDCSFPQTLSAATTRTITRKMKSVESQILPREVEWWFTPTSWAYRAGQDICGCRQRQGTRPVVLKKWKKKNTKKLLLKMSKDLSRAWELIRFSWVVSAQSQQREMKAPADTKDKFETVRGGREKARCQHSSGHLKNLPAHRTEPTVVKTHCRNKQKKTFSP